jgi:hypothetical protein
MLHSHQHRIQQQQLSAAQCVGVHRSACHPLRQNNDMKNRKENYRCSKVDIHKASLKKRKKLL